MRSPTLNKAFQGISRHGVAGVVRKGFQQLGGTACLRMKMIRRPTFANLDDLLTFGFETCMGIVRPIQVISEIRRLLEIVQQLQPSRLMEIGTANGGTLFLFSRVARPDALIISLDLPGGEFGGGYPIWKRGLFRSFALPKQQLELMRADSHQPQSLENIKSLCAGKPLDFLLIDGDHTYAGVRQDFEMYAPLVRSGGVIAFHDISPSQNDATNEVRQFWVETKARYPSEEIIDPQHRWAGIGVLRIP